MPRGCNFFSLKYISSCTYSPRSLHQTKLPRDLNLNVWVNFFIKLSTVIPQTHIVQISFTTHSVAAIAFIGTSFLWHWRWSNGIVNWTKWSAHGGESSYEIKGLCPEARPNNNAIAKYFITVCSILSVYFRLRGTLFIKLLNFYLFNSYTFLVLFFGSSPIMLLWNNNYRTEIKFYSINL